MGHQPAEIREEDDMQIYQKPSAGVVFKAAQLSVIFRSAEEAITGVPVLAEHWLNVIEADVREHMEYIVDSCPVILAKGPRSGYAKVAGELCRKSCNSSRKEWYYGLKIHAFVARKPGRLPVPLSVMASGAVQHDLTVAKQIMEDCLYLNHGRLYADKAYADAAWAELLKNGHAIELLTPRKRRKGDVLVSGDSFSSFVSSLRQPVECFFNWLNRLTNIQSASLVRSLSGLFLHVFGRLAAASALLLFNP